MLTRIYRTADGRDFPVTFESEEAAASTHAWDPEHNPSPLTPLDVAVWVAAAGGTGRAREECGFDASDAFIGGPAVTYINGFTYWHEVKYSAEVIARRDAANERLRAEYGTAAPFWQRWCLPRAMRSVEQLRTAGVETPVREMVDVFGYGYEQTFLMWGIENEPLRDFLKAELGDEGLRIAVELSQGYPTATLEANQALWEMAQDAEPAVREWLGRGTLRLEEVAALDGGPEFLQSFERYMDRYGWRTLDWDISTPTVRERPEATLQVIARTISDGLPEPAAMVAEAAARREEQVEELEERFRAEPAKLAEFRARMARHAAYLGVKEGRALWQLSLNGALRLALLRKGERLAGAGAIEQADDVFFLLPDEIDAAIGLDAGPVGQGAGAPSALRQAQDERAGEAAQDERGVGVAQDERAGSGRRQLADRVKERRTEHSRWVGVTPPATIGGHRDAEAAETTTNEGVLNGIGVSKGAVTGRARVLRSFEDQARLLPGEVLVCPTTTPAWTPLFGIAAAVIAEGGGMLSHTAIAAREYGIPAVVAVRSATRLIADGALVAVDGAAGTVSPAE